MKKVFEPKKRGNQYTGKQEGVVRSAVGFYVPDRVVVMLGEEDQVLETHQPPSSEVALGFFGLEPHAFPNWVFEERLRARVVFYQKGLELKFAYELWNEDFPHFVMEKYDTFGFVAHYKELVV